jgi:hypothetical protein
VESAGHLVQPFRADAPDAESTLQIANRIAPNAVMPATSIRGAVALRETLENNAMLIVGFRLG